MSEDKDYELRKYLMEQAKKGKYGVWFGIKPLNKLRLLKWLKRDKVAEEKYRILIMCIKRGDYDN